MQDAAGTFADDWIERGIIDISWDFDGLDIASMGREQIRAAYASTHPAESKQKVAANVSVRLLDLDAFVRHYVEVYDKTDDETRSILPLARIWWPA